MIMDMDKEITKRLEEENKDISNNFILLERAINSVVKSPSKEGRRTSLKSVRKAVTELKSFFGNRTNEMIITFLCNGILTVGGNTYVRRNNSKVINRIAVATKWDLL